MTRAAVSARDVRERRTAKNSVDPFVPLATLWEKERGVDRPGPSLTVFLAGNECPFTCVFCDLWKNTLDAPTPEGAIPEQIRRALLEARTIPKWSTIKLYNASNFFDDRAVPPTDDDAIAALVAPFTRVVVECHPRFLDDRCFSFAERVEGQLEVALGLETVHPMSFTRLNKGATLEEFGRAFDRLIAYGIDVRAFVLLAPPFVPANEIVSSAIDSVRWSVERGARHVTIIPTRNGNGTMEYLQATGDWLPPTIGMLESVLQQSVTLPAIVTADLWDAEQLSRCACGPERIGRLHHANLTGTLLPPIACNACGAAP